MEIDKQSKLLNGIKKAKLIINNESNNSRRQPMNNDSVDMVSEEQMMAMRSQPSNQPSDKPKFIQNKNMEKSKLPSFIKESFKNKPAVNPTTSSELDMIHQSILSNMGDQLEDAPQNESVVTESKNEINEPKNISQSQTNISIEIIDYIIEKTVDKTVELLFEKIYNNKTNIDENIEIKIGDKIFGGKIMNFKNPKK